MAVDLATYRELIRELAATDAKLVAVSKTKPSAAILELYEAGQKDFGENYVQELCAKQETLPIDIRWHFIGHLQRNKVKQIASFVHLIHGVDSLRLLKEINKQGETIKRVIPVLLQIFIAKEETKFGLDEKELEEIIELLKKNKFPFVQVNGLMGMATLTEDLILVKNEFAELNRLFRRLRQDFPADILSMGMSSDYKIALAEGSTMIRIGSALFGERNKN